ncbi:hypothetical protein ED733_000588 [Metarhizium rileyi]|uniref:Uncharacterized protein n=1 Tax=Metarhizium rileyi (strain RCEF 4871) TaxID=1649241 RepID=A0A5C6G6Z7_METRR|nr:hypothetical protein ED733_000588 [Metarhizium rileyi]
MADDSPQPPCEVSLSQRLRSRKFIGQEAVDAIHGRKLPFHLGRPLVRYCIVRGIRHHLDFAQGEASALKELLPIFTKAINARLIMSNQVPDMQTREEMPYCIWHPDIPSEDTLRKLAQRYPDFQYQVGRTCAIAGYTDLYNSLRILPEAAIAEEARESGNLQIYGSIIKEVVKWKVFDDYTGTILVPTPSHLNADTVVYKELHAFRQGFKTPVGRIEGEEGDPESDDEPDSDDDNWLFSDQFTEGPYGYNPLHHNVTGDMGLDAPDTWQQMPKFRKSIPPTPSRPVSQAVLDLLCSPLPADLPSCDKNILIVMAAYRGDLDRYCRLRRPYMVGNELEAIIRGIYHNSQFAKWWSTQPPPPEMACDPISAAICARFIMNDDISFALRQANDELPQGWSIAPPQMIFYPDIACPDTYEALARAIPTMRMPVARAAIYADYKSVFDIVMTELNQDSTSIRLDYTLYVQSLASPNPYYRETLERLAKEQGTSDTLKTRSPDSKPWEQMSLTQARTRDRSNLLYDEIYAWREIISTADGQYHHHAIYDGIQCDTIQLERYLSLPVEWRPTERDVDESTRERRLDYKDWPPRMAELLKTKRGSVES